jgi:hypothetical protein
MEVLVGALLALGIIITTNLVLRDPVKKLGNGVLRYSQSHIYSLMSPVIDYLPTDKEIHQVKRQSKAHLEKSYVRVVIAEDQAYWIKDNALFTAEVVEGFVDKESTRRVDTMRMDSVELEKTMAIVEKLREGLDEDSGAGN